VLLVGLLATANWGAALGEPLFWWMVVVAIAGELVPLRVPFRGDFHQITLSTIAVFVVLLRFGPGPAAGVQVAVSVLDDVVHHKPLFKLSFNAAQYTLAVGAAGVVLGMLTGTTDRMSTSALAVALLAGCSFYVVNNTLTSGAIALAHDNSFFDVLRGDLLFEGATGLVLFTQAPLVLSVAHDSLWLLPLFVPAIIAAYRATRTAAERDHRALHDTLTELPNREHLTDRVERALANGDSVALALIDLNGFGAINGTLGHAVGDELLRSVAGRVSNEVVNAFCARVGGDEFVVTRVGGDPVALGAEVRALFETPFRVAQLPFTVDASIGVASGRAPSAASELLQHADVALGVARRRRSGLEQYSPAIDGRDPSRIVLLGELRTALDEQQFVLHFQPKIDVKSGEVIGAEALVRWQHPVRGLVFPDDFIPLVESTSLMGQFTRYVARRALEQCAEWRRLGLDLTVAINVSAHNLVDPDFPEQLAAILEDLALTPHSLEVEITESAAMDDTELAILELARLRAVGITVALDDFGTGHSSLTHLHRLPVDVVKIDKSFVLEMASDEDAASIVATIIGMSHIRGLRVVAEGVESETTCARLAELGCDVVQGYYISRPLPADRFRGWLASCGHPVRRFQALPAPDDCYGARTPTSSTASSRLGP
jgi:diguanylate cyclase (GGDEF)-like protein